jgi:hypothetical protein
MLKKNPSKNPFYEKIKIFKKGTFVIESFVTISSFDYDCTLIVENSTIFNIDLARIFLSFKITYLLILGLTHKYEYGRIKGQNSKALNFVKCGV